MRYNWDDTIVADYRCDICDYKIKSRTDFTGHAVACPSCRRHLYPIEETIVYPVLNRREW